jgi:NADH-quinone oxidoreductase subunit L
MLSGSPCSSTSALNGRPSPRNCSRWIDSGTLEVAWALRIDTLTAVMMIVVTVVSTMVHIYSIGYMHHDPHVPRFMAYLSLFTFFMLMLVTADNLVQMFFGWEGVGLASYLLIGFWYKKPSACAAAIKAFIVNRVGDFGFALGIFAVYVMFDSIHLDTIFAAAPAMADATLVVFGTEFHALTVICLLLFVGAMGKSAQFLLHTWLPDAMEGPTPVSALIHAATMVTAGVFMVARMSPLFEFSDTALAVVTIVGASTCVLRGDGRLRAERHQARDRLFDVLAARLHVLRLRRLGLCGGRVPSVHARLLQGAAVPGRRLGHPRHVRRAGHAQDGRAGRWCR